MEPLAADTLLLSDVHLGSEVSRAGDALRLLKHGNFSRLILLGDIFSDLNFARLKKDHWQFLGYIRKLANPKRHVEVVWVEGNHDRGLTAVMSHLVGVRVYQEYQWTYCGIRHLAVHGHQFDRFSLNQWVRAGAHLYLLLQKLDLGSRRVARSLDGLNTRWLGLSGKVSRGAVALARARHCERVFCGHTHVPLHVEQDGIAYYNCGGWVGARATYAAVNEHGAHIHEYDGTDHRYPGEERSDTDPAAADVFDDPGLLPVAEL